MAYEALSRRTYGVPFLSITYQMRLNGVSWSMYCVRTTHGRRTLRSRGVSTTIARRCISNRHVNAIIASIITSELKIAAVALLWSLLRLGRNIFHGPIVGRAEKPRRSLVRFWLYAERIFQLGHYYRLVEEYCD